MCVILTVISKLHSTVSRNLFCKSCFNLAFKSYKKNTSLLQNSYHILALKPTTFHQTNRLYHIGEKSLKKKGIWCSEVKLLKLQKTRREYWNRLNILIIAMSSSLVIACAYLVYIIGSPNLDESGNLIEDEYSVLPLPIQYLKRMMNEVDNFRRLISQPVSKKLLPDPYGNPYYQPNYTLVMEMSDLLLHPEWTLETGWRFKKRPGVDKFLELVTLPTFELVVFSGEQSSVMKPVLDSLDPYGFIMHRLTRESTEFVEGVYVKNLDYLNRDLSKVIVVDWNKKSVKFHRENCILIPRWNGHDDDNLLVDLAAFLRAIASSGVNDVRDILSEYKQYDNAVEVFRENQRKLLEEINEENVKKGTNYASIWAKTFLKMQRS